MPTLHRESELQVDEVELQEEYEWGSRRRCVGQSLYAILVQSQPVLRGTWVVNILVGMLLDNDHGDPEEILTELKKFDGQQVRELVDEALEELEENGTQERASAAALVRSELVRAHLLRTQSMCEVRLSPTVNWPARVSIATNATRRAHMSHDITDISSPISH